MVSSLGCCMLAFSMADVGSLKEELSFFVGAFTNLFVAIDPLVAVPIFLSLTVQDSLVKKRAIALKASLVAFATLLLFALLGNRILGVLGISHPAFLIAGGGILFLTALDMMRAHISPTKSTKEEQRESSQREDVSVVPLGIPLLAGPTAIITITRLMQEEGHGRATPLHHKAIVLVCLLVISIIGWVLFHFSAKAERFLSKSNLRAFERIMGLLLAAFAVQSILKGIFQALGRPMTNLL